MDGNFNEVVFTITEQKDFLPDLLMNELAEIGFDSFDSNDEGFKAYISVYKFDLEVFSELIKQYQDQYSFKYEINVIPYQNWNEVWESNFPPVIIANQLYIYANFHPINNQFPFQIKMHPKMAFGTGHHETTFQMAEQLLDLDVNGLRVLDMGCGTGILAILAAMKGAKSLLAIDNDPIAVQSCIENFEINNIQAEVICGDAKSLHDSQFDLILANINRNILLNDMKIYSQALVSNAFILFSGFYVEDLNLIIESAENNRLKYQSHASKNNWVVALFQKN